MDNILGKLKNEKYIFIVKIKQRNQITEKQ